MIEEDKCMQLGQEGNKPKNPLPEQKQQRPGDESEMNPRPQFLAPTYKGSAKLDDKVAIITGGDSGIGRSVSILFAREGADIAILYLDAEQKDAEETKYFVEKEGRQCLLIPCDVRNSDCCIGAVTRVVDEFGHLDIVVNNAAYQHHQSSIEDISDEQLKKTFETNIFGYFYMVRAALPHLSEGSVIINTGSITGLEGSGQLLDYSATKGAIHAFTKSLAQSLNHKKIRVNCVAPGPVWTPLNVADKDPDEVSKHGEDTPMQRPAQPDEIAPAYVFFASNTDTSYITGEVLTLLGGETTAG